LIDLLIDKSSTAGSLVLFRIQQMLFNMIMTILPHTDCHISLMNEHVKPRVGSGL